MSNFVTRDALSITCTCTHGGGGHMPACAMFTATAEQYREVCAERDKLRAVAKAARRAAISAGVTGDGAAFDMQ